MGIAHVLESIQPAASLYPLPAACDTAVYATKHTLPREHAVHGYPRVVALDGREEMEVEMHFKLMRCPAWRKSLVCSYYPCCYVIMLYECRVACDVYEVAGKNLRANRLFFSRSYAYSIQY